MDSNSSEVELIETAVVRPRLTKNILDHIARVEVDLEPDEPCIVSYHYMYKDYLKEHDLIDVNIYTD